MDDIDLKFIDSYPRVYPIASVMEISEERIDQFFEQMEDSVWIREHLDHKGKQLHLSMTMKRLYYYNKPFNLEEYKDKDIEEIANVFGKYNTRFVCEFLQVI